MRATVRFWRSGRHPVWTARNSHGCWSHKAAPQSLRAGLRKLFSQAAPSARGFRAITWVSGVHDGRL